MNLPRLDPKVIRIKFNDSLEIINGLVISTEMEMDVMGYFKLPRVQGV